MRIDVLLFIALSSISITSSWQTTHPHISSISMIEGICICNIYIYTLSIQFNSSKNSTKQRRPKTTKGKKIYPDKRKERKRQCGARKNLKLSLLRLSQKVWHEDIANLICCLIDVEAHSLGAEVFADDVELEAMGRDH
jgi:hypothetical protein